MQTVEEGGQVVSAHPAGQLDLSWGEDGLGIEQGLNVAGLGHRRAIGQPHDDALQHPGTKGHPHHVPHLQVSLQGCRDGIMESAAQGIVRSLGWCFLVASDGFMVPTQVDIDHHFSVASAHLCLTNSEVRRQK